MTVIPLPAATLVLIGGDPLTGPVLMGIRNRQLSFAPGAAVFPGGRLEPGESHEQAALRELTEETGLELAALEPLTPLLHFGRAITPPVSARRFDTQFFAASIRHCLPPLRGDAELEQIGWYSHERIDQLPTMGITRRALAAARHALAQPGSLPFANLNRDSLPFPEG